MPHGLDIRPRAAGDSRTAKRRPRRFVLPLGLVVVVGTAGGCIAEKQCRPGCVDADTRLLCDADGNPRAEPCPIPEGSCAVASCSEGVCGMSPSVGASCGFRGLGRCNEGYACLGPDTHLTSGTHYTCAVTDDGDVWCWGSNARQELGDGTTLFRGNPVRVRNLPPAVDVSAGDSSTCVVTRAGEVYCWGNNATRAVDPSSTELIVKTPARIDVPGVRFVSVSTGGAHTCALTDQGTVWCWGSTGVGQAGVDPALVEGDTARPTLVANLDHVKQLDSVKHHSCAVRTVEPSLVCWGSNAYVENPAGTSIDGVLGPAAGEREFSAAPVPVPVPATVLRVALGPDATYVRAVDGKAYAWGLNDHGQLGTGSSAFFNPNPEAVKIDDKVVLPGVEDPVRTSGPGECTRLQDSSLGGRYYCWGANDRGELAMESQVGRTLPYANEATALPNTPRTTSQMALSQDHACIIIGEPGDAPGTQNTAIWCYGINSEVGNGSTDPASNQIFPAPVVWSTGGMEEQ
ncbi:MAG TPA: hypothetical protein VHE30_22695 [Polyangiaceae bacterium]|nr:hypothetical protein [Polyangiaceae bacterium]